MIFSVQRFVEDYFERRGLADVDQYAIRVANQFDRLPANASVDTIANALASIRTTFFRRNREVTRRGFEAALADVLNRRFKKKRTSGAVASFERALPKARARVLSGRHSIDRLLLEFKRAVEARGVDAFWQSRVQNRLRARPESVAQALLAVFVKGVLGGGGLVLREFSSGTGFVDVGIVFSRVLHLIELKILTAKFVGVDQLERYMALEGRRSGWLLLIDARPPTRRVVIPLSVSTGAGLIRVVTIDIHPLAPHSIHAFRRLNSRKVV